MMTKLVVLLVLLLVVVTSAEDFNGKVYLKNLSPSSVPFSMSTVSVALRGSEDLKPITTFVRADGTFTLRNVVPGVYLLEVHTQTFDFEPERFELRADATAPKTRHWDDRRAMLMIGLDRPSVYFLQRQGFDLMGMFKNPMVIMLGFSAVMMFVMPKLTANMDPEELRKMQGLDKRYVRHDGQVVEREALLPKWDPFSSMRLN